MIGGSRSREGGSRDGREAEWKRRVHLGRCESRALPLWGAITPTPTTTATRQENSRHVLPPVPPEPASLDSKSTKLGFRTRNVCFSSHHPRHVPSTQQKPLEPNNRRSAVHTDTLGTIYTSSHALARSSSAAMSTSSFALASSSRALRRACSASSSPLLLAISAAFWLWDTADRARVSASSAAAEAAAAVTAAAALHARTQE